MEKIIRFMHDRYTLNVSIYDESYLESIIENRMIFSSLGITNDYPNLLDKMPSEVKNFIDSLTNSNTQSLETIT